MIDLDFETRSAVDIKLGPWRYSEDKTTSILCFAYAFGGEKAYLWLPGDPMPVWVKDRLWELLGAPSVRAHNAMFEKAVWRNVLVARYGWPDIPDQYWKCSAAKCAAHALPRALGPATVVMNTVVKKDDEGHRVMLKLSKPRKPTKNNPKFWHEPEDVPQDFQTLYKYCKTDVLSENCLDEKIRDLSPREQQVWQLDQKINARGVYLDLAAVKGAIQIIEQYEMLCELELAKLSKNAFWSGTQLFQMKSWLADKGSPVDSLDKAAVDALLSQRDLPEDVKRVLQIRKSLGKTSTRKLKAMQESVCEDGRVKDLLMYHGASTGRWAGKGIQIQNFPRVKVENLEEKMAALRIGELSAVAQWGDPMHLISSCLRGMILAAPGKKFYVADYAAIEARGVCWLAGQESMLNLFREGKDPYRFMAGTIYSKPLDQVDGGQKDGVERQLGKQAVLGCGYQMSAPKFQLTCQSYKMEVDLPLAEKAVNAYRTTNSNVVRFWWDQEKAAKRAIKSREVVQCGPVRWAVSRGFLYCRLPSGRVLAYASPKVEMGKTPWGESREQISFMAMNDKNQWVRTRTYGGSITENITQAVCRDIMVEAMLRLEAAGYKVLFTVHDEVVAETPEDFGSLEEFLALLTEVPKWAEGFPIKAEGWTGNRYRK